jgi:hypothetical protein
MSNHKKEKGFHEEGLYREEEADKNEYDDELDEFIRQFCFNVWQDIKEAAEGTDIHKRPPTG